MLTELTVVLIVSQHILSQVSMLSTLNFAALYLDYISITMKEKKSHVIKMLKTFQKWWGVGLCPSLGPIFEGLL